MEKILLKNGKLLLEDEIIKGDILISEGKIKKIGNFRKTPKEKKLEKINCEGLYVSPGFIDLQVNGALGQSFINGSKKSFRKILNYHIKQGTTSMLATAVANSIPKMRRVAKIASKFEREGIIGVNFNGPFFSPIKSKIINQKNILEGNLENFHKLIDGIEDVVKIITLAPEKTVQGLISQALKNDIILSFGHSEADYDQTIKAINEGITFFSHLFNAMPPFHHRNPGPAGAALNSKKAKVGLIVDGHHLHPKTVKIVQKIKKPDKICLITDATSATGRENGEYNWGSIKIKIKNGKVTSKKEKLAGSAITMIEAVKNFHDFTKAPLNEVIKMASLNPAKLLNIQDKKGSLKKNKQADIIIFDKNFKLSYIIKSGEIYYQNKKN